MGRVPQLSQKRVALGVGNGDRSVLLQPVAPGIGRGVSAAQSVGDQSQSTGQIQRGLMYGACVLAAAKLAHEIPVLFDIITFDDQFKRPGIAGVPGYQRRILTGLIHLFYPDTSTRRTKFGQNHVLHRRGKLNRRHRRIEAVIVVVIRRLLRVATHDLELLQQATIQGFGEFARQTRLVAQSLDLAEAAVLHALLLHQVDDQAALAGTVGNIDHEPGQSFALTARAP